MRNSLRKAGKQEGPLKGRSLSIFPAFLLSLEISS